MEQTQINSTFIEHFPETLIMSTDSLLLPDFSDAADHFCEAKPLPLI